jgi:uncharacterized protein YceK
MKSSRVSFDCVLLIVLFLGGCSSISPMIRAAAEKFEFELFSSIKMHTNGLDAGLRELTALKESVLSSFSQQCCSLHGL